jgi:alkylation response protein AidB-like acyl-CoA dehydrogenase
MAYNGMRMQTQLAKTGVVGPEASIGKLYWSTWHKSLGELSMDILGPAGQIVPEAGDGRYVLDDLQRSYMFSRSETIYAGSSEIQKNIIGERVLGLPREPR